MDNVQKVCHFNNTPLSQTFRIYHQFVVEILLPCQEKPYMDLLQYVFSPVLLAYTFCDCGLCL
jgi:hypothetical protein